MATLSDIAFQVAVTNLRRPDIQVECVELAKAAYLSICAKVPFDELCSMTAERAMSTTTTIHSLSDIDPPLNGIMSVRATYGTTRSRRMRRTNTRVFDAENQSSVAGYPARYARFGNTIEFDRVASSSSFTYRLRYWTTPTIATNAGDTVLVIPGEWHELVKYETMYRAYIELLDQPEKALMMMQPAILPRQGSPVKIRSSEVGIIPRLWNDLLRTVSQREHVDEDLALSPIRPR